MGPNYILKLWYGKGNTEKMKRQPTEQEKIFVNDD